MPDLIEGYFEAEKSLGTDPFWTKDGTELLLTSPLDIDGETVEGLTFHGKTFIQPPDKSLTFRIDYIVPGHRKMNVARIEWNPSAPHNNRGIGPTAFQFLDIDGSHYHPFSENWALGYKSAHKRNLPIAVPIDPNPADFASLLTVVGVMFNITNIDLTPPPPWEAELLL